MAWPDETLAKPAAPPQPASDAPSVTAPAAPMVHVMPSWQPSSPQPVLPSDISSSAARAVRRWSQAPTAEAPRRFADPFAMDDEGANCLRCGYLVEPVREAKGLMTCAACG